MQWPYCHVHWKHLRGSVKLMHEIQVRFLDANFLLVSSTQECLEPSRRGVSSPPPLPSFAYWIISGCAQQPLLVVPRDPNICRDQTRINCKLCSIGTLQPCQALSTQMPGTAMLSQVTVLGISILFLFLKAFASLISSFCVLGYIQHTLRITHASEPAGSWYLGMELRSAKFETNTIFQVLFLDLHSEMTPMVLKGPMWYWRQKPGHLHARKVPDFPESL